MSQGYILDFWPVAERWPALLGGIWMSLLLTAIGVAGGSALGIFGALARRSRLRPLRWMMVSVRSWPPAFWGPGVAHYPG
jgi:ABC-type amino acid transport system permease subunit